MPAKAKEPSRVSTPISQLKGLANQGVESLVAAQKILLDLTAQQTALVIGMVRERLTKPSFRPDTWIAKITDKGVENVTAAGKIVLDLAGSETSLLLEGVKDGLGLPVAAGTVAEVVRHRVDTFIGLQKRLLDATAEKTHAVAESYQEGQGWRAGESLSELAKRGIEDFVETEKKFLDLAAKEVTAATKAGAEGFKPAGPQFKVLTQLARQGVEKYVDAQKKLLNLAIDQFASNGERIEAVRKEAHTTLAVLTQKSVHNLVTAQKSLMDLAIKPIKVSAKDEAPKPRRGRPRGKKHSVEAHKSAEAHQAA